MTKARNANREEFWRQAVQRRADSGLTIDDFCAAEGLKATTYNYWQREIRRRDDKLQAVTNDVPTLAAVQLVHDQGSSATVEILARNGYLVRVHEHATAEQVLHVLQAISELSEGC